MQKFVFIDSNNVIRGVCTADRKLTAEEIYPGFNYAAIEVEDEDIIERFLMYEYDGVSFTFKDTPPLPPPEPTELELLKEKYAILQGAVDFIVMNP